MRDLETLSHGLVLLQEICQGYDNPGYRKRALNYLALGADAVIRKYLLVRWDHRLLTTTELIRQIEQRLLQNAR